MNTTGPVRSPIPENGNVWRTIRSNVPARHWARMCFASPWTRYEDYILFGVFFLLSPGFAPNAKPETMVFVFKWENFHYSRFSLKSLKEIFSDNIQSFHQLLNVTASCINVIINIKTLTDLWKHYDDDK